jgi:AAHS family 4-hydroxybenzoate transporter-like MFS transporter
LGMPRLRVVLLCAVAMMFNGYSIVAVSIAVPALASAWNVSGPEFSNVFVASSVGMVIGAVVAGPSGDGLGCKPVLIVSLVVLAISSLACVFATSVTGLVVWRCLTGIGIGGIIPATAALTADLVPERLCAPIVMAIFTCDSLGGFLGGQLAARLLPDFGWPVIFWLGGLPPLALIPAVLGWLPEARCAAAGGPPSPADEALHRMDASAEYPGFGLFRDGMAPATAAVWIFWFVNYLGLSLISYWLPGVLAQFGQTSAVSGHASGLITTATIVGALALVPFCWRFGPRAVLAVISSTGALAVAVVGLVHLERDPLLLAVFLMRFCIIGGITGGAGMTAALYPAVVRATGLGWALAIGRAGILGGPPLGRALLSAGWPPSRIFLCACACALIATLCVVTLHILARRRSPQPVTRLA